jgi:hypothetical protein
LTQHFFRVTSTAAAMGLALICAGRVEASPIQLTLTATDVTNPATYSTTFSDVVYGGDTVTGGSSPNDILVTAGVQGGISFSGEDSLAIVGASSNTLITSALSVSNTSSDTYTLTAALSGMNFVGPANTVALTGSGTWLNAVGSVMTLAFYNDPTNTLGAATGTDAPGNLVGFYVSSPALDPTSSYQYSPGTVFLENPDGGEFSMTETWTYTLLPGASLISRGQTEADGELPEPSSLPLLVTGLAILSAAVWRARATARART